MNRKHHHTPPSSTCPGLSVEHRDQTESIKVVTPDGYFSELTLEPGVMILVCPGPRFGGDDAARFARSASLLCQVRPRVVLDMSEIESVDADGLLTISSFVRACRDAGVTPRLCSPQRSVRGMLASTGVHNLVDVYHSRRHASLAR
jgi:anti-anti-sigma factor